MQEKLDSIVFARRMVVAATVEPDFSSKELCEAYGVMDPLLVPVKMLKSGEYSKLMELSLNFLVLMTTRASTKKQKTD